jgi:lactate dehydrogenase-like 2-hydroxyacid dehydrogenase
MTHKKVVATPHSAFNTVEAVNSLFDVTIKNINLFVDGKDVEDRVN